MARPTLVLDIRRGTKIAAGLVDQPAVLLYKDASPPQPPTPTRWATAHHHHRHWPPPTAPSPAVDLGRADRPARRHHQPDQHGTWRGFGVRDRVAAAGTRGAVRLAGDGCTWRWASTGAAPGGAAFLLGMVVSTGIGSGLVLDGAPDAARTGNASHVDHVGRRRRRPADTAAADAAPRQAIASGPHPGGVGREQGWTGGDAGTQPTPPPTR